MRERRLRPLRVAKLTESSLETSIGGSCTKCEVGPQLILPRKYIPQTGLEPDQNRFEFIKRKMVLASLNSMKCGVRHADLLGELRVRKAASRLSQISRELSVEIPLHPRRLAKYSSRMRDDLRLR